MSYRHFAQLKHAWLRMLLVATVPLACAVGVKPEFDDSTGDPSGGAGSAGSTAMAGHSSGGSLPFAGSTSGGTAAKAGAAGTSGGASGSGGASASPFGGTSSSGGKGGGGGGGAAGAAGGGAAGAAGASGAAGAAGAAGAGTGTCACPKKLTWADNTNLSWGPGACLVVGSKTYLYTGMKAQTWANKDCNPTMQLAWCSDVGADYKFMACN